jgi:DNA-binding winged helix-turn-helix (wHTH) protein/Tol biopolymer transport system component
VRISFGPFAFDRQSRLLWREGAEVALPPRVIGVLEILIDRQGQVVTRQDLMDAVWKDAFVTDTSLAEAVSFLRQALGDDPQAPRYIQTIHRRGYRFLAPLTPLIEDRGLTPALRGLTPNSGFAVASGDRLVSATPGGSKEWELLPWIVALLCTLLLAALTWGTVHAPRPEAPLAARFEVTPANGTSFAPGDRRTPAIDVSADGRALAWSACDNGSGTCALYVRPVDRFDASRLAGTEGAVAPFFSPDGRWIAFFGDGKLKKIASSGGSPSVLADAPSPGGGAWGPNGRIVFSGLPAGGLSLVGDQGGPVTALTTPDARRGELRHVLPAWLPGGGILFTITTSPVADAPGQLAVMPRDATTWKTLRGGVTRALAPGPGYLLIAAGDDVQAATFDERTVTLTGGGDSMLASITSRAGLAQLAIASSGTLAGFETPPSARMSWSDRPDADAGAVARLTSIAISPDSRRAAGVVADANGSDVWIVDLASGGQTRMTYGGTNVSPAWSADGRQIYFATRTTGSFALASRRVDDRGEVPLSSPADTMFPTSVSPDGRIAVTIAGSSAVPPGRTSVGILDPANGASRMLTDGPFDESAATFSPDGRWLALESDESGRTEIVVRDLRGNGRRFAMSADGGTHPRWSEDGRSLYFESGRRLMRAAFDPSREPDGPRADVAFDRAGARVAAVTPAGRVLVRQQPSPPTAIVILQWLRELRERMPQPVTAPR